MEIRAIHILIAEKATDGKNTDHRIYQRSGMVRPGPFGVSPRSHGGD
jgi:hypothetical protein